MTFPSTFPQADCLENWLEKLFGQFIPSVYYVEHIYVYVYMYDTFI